MLGLDRSVVGPRISVEYRSEPQVLPGASESEASLADMSSASLGRSVDPVEAILAQPDSELRVAGETRPAKVSEGQSEARPERLRIDELRSSWRDDPSLAPPGEAPLRLTDVPGLDAVGRSYLSAWQKDVQRIGRLNFPTDADGNRLRGSLRLLVGIESDGSLAYVRITESSGDQRLDSAAMDIVRLAAPFSPLPLSLRRGSAVLEIERTWRIGASLLEL